MMLIGHLSDTHVGAIPYNLKEREEDFYEAFHEAIQEMMKDRVELIIHAGDIFDIPKPGGTALVKLVNELKELKDKEIRFYFTLGEHDISRLPGIPSPFLYKEVDLATYIGVEEPVMHNGVVIVGFHKYRKTEIDELQEKLRALDTKVANLEGKKVLVLHQALVEFHKWAGEITSMDLPKTFDYYAMGHLHDRFENCFEGLKGPVCYPGSIDATASEGIKEYKKGFYITDLSGDEAKPEWIELKSLRKQLSVEISYDTMDKEVKVLIERIKELSKKPLLNLKVRGKGVDSARVASALGSLQNYSLYQVWEAIEEGPRFGKDYENKPSDIDQEMLEKTSEITGSPERGEFTIHELLPQLAEGRTEEAIDLLWSAYKKGRFNENDRKY